MTPGEGDLTELFAALRADAEGVATALLGPPNRGGSRSTLRWGAKASMSVEVRGPKRGLWFDHSAGAGGYLLALVRHVHGCSFSDAVAWARNWTGLPAAQPDNDNDRARRARQDADRRVRQAEVEAKGQAEADAELASNIAWSQRLAARSSPADDTLACRYLQQARGIPRPGNGWPDAIRWNAAHHALVAVATLADGTVQRVQRVHLGADGRKVTPQEMERRGLQAVKMTNGPGAGAAVRLPGDHAGPLLLAEGIETGLAVWAATGHETWIALGPIPGLAPPAGRPVVVVSDDNPVSQDLRHGQAAKALARAVLEWRANGLNIGVATPWPERRHDKSDMADLILAAGSDAVAARIAVAIPKTSSSILPPGAFVLRGIAGRSWTRLPARHPFITEKRQDALDRQGHEIRRAIVLGGKVGAAHRDLARRRAAALDELDDPSPAAKAAVTKRLTLEVAMAWGYGRRLLSPERLLVTGAMGTGKTITSLETVAEIRHPCIVWVTELSLKKSAENLTDYQRFATRDSLPGMLVRGRAQKDPSRDGAQMCRRNKVAERLAKQGLSVGRTLCVECPFSPDCAYLAQQRAIDALGHRAVFFLAGQHAFTKSPAPAPDLWIADERLDPVVVASVPLDSLDPGLFRLGVCGDMATVVSAEATIAQVRMCMIDTQPLASFTRKLIDRPALEQLVRLLAIMAEPDVSRLSGDQPDDALIATLDAIEADQRAAKALTLLRAVVREFDMPRRNLNAVTYCPAAKTFTVSRLKTLHGMADASILHLDGTGSPTLARALFGQDMRHVEVRIERDADVTGTAGRSYSTRSLTGMGMDGKPVPSLTVPSARLRKEIATVADRMPGPCLVVSGMEAEDRLGEILAGDTQAAHFNALRGLNTWKDCPSALIVGSLSLRVAELEAVARAYMASDPRPFVSSADAPVDADYGYRDRGWPWWATVMRRLRDGSLSPVEVPVHPDPRVQEVLEQLRDSEVLQAADRVRPIFNRRHLVLANNLALDVTYDRVLSHRDLVAGGTRLDLILDDLGVLPLGGPDLYRAWQGRGRFASLHAAAKCLKSLSLSPPHLHRIVSMRLGGAYPQQNQQVIKYRRRGQSGSPCHAIVDTQRHPNARAALERIVGKLALFELVALAVTAPALAAPAPAPVPQPVVVPVPGPARLIIVPTSSPPIPVKDPPDPPPRPRGTPAPAPVVCNHEDSFRRGPHLPVPLEPCEGSARARQVAHLGRAPDPWPPLLPEAEGEDGPDGEVGWWGYTAAPPQWPRRV